MNIGYARVSTDEQHAENQIEQLVKAGCDRRHIYQETASGGRIDRPQLHDCLKHLREGDTLIVWKLDRLSRSLSDLLRILEKVDQAGASFKSLTESLDVSGPCGRLMMHMLAAFNQFEREIIKERTKLGLQRARLMVASAAVGSSSRPNSNNRRSRGYALVRRHSRRLPSSSTSIVRPSAG